MMKAKKNKPPAKGVQTGRNLPNNLPNKYKSYTPGRRQAGQPPKQQAVGPDIEAKAKRGWRSKLAWSLLAILLAALAAAVFVAAWDVRNISSAEKKLFGTGNVMNLINSGSLKTDQYGHVNVLIAGYSVDDPLHQGANLTDSIMVISMDPANHTGYMLSIPRDLYVNIPGYGHAKINEAYKDGGMGLLQQVVEQVIGVNISYNFLVDYSAVRGIVDAIGGIDITVNSPEGRLYDPDIDWVTHGILVDLANGRHHLNGEQALDFTRARGDAYGSIGFAQADYQRTADQRQVVAAIKSKLNWKIILNPRQNGKVLGAIANHVKTNAPAGVARPLFGLYNSISSSSMKSYSLRDIGGKSYVVGTYYSGSTQSPAAGMDDFSAIQAAIAQLEQ